MERLQFKSDYQVQPHPQVVRAVMGACATAATDSYGEDEITKTAISILQHHFGEKRSVFFMSNCTAANHLAIQTLVERPYQSVICSAGAHINTAECGGLESLGIKLLPVSGPGGKLTVEQIFPLLEQRNDIHLTYPRVLSISNATERGEVYSIAELRKLGRFAKKHSLLFHIDGARLANTAAHLQQRDLAKLTFEVGADAVTLGATKNGGMLGDAVIFRNKKLGEIATRLQKQRGQLCARHRQN